MKTYIYGAGAIGKHVVEKMEKCGEKPDGFIDSYKMGSYVGYPIIPLEKIEKKSKVIISILNTDDILEVYNMLKRARISGIFWFYDIDEKCNVCGETFFERECLDLSDWGDVIMPHVELHISDKCNLNCKGCTHFSPLFSEVGANLKQKMDDIKSLKTLFSDIFRIDILGGEPLLNPELKEYVIELRQLLPKTFIQIYTNGLLIPKLQSDVLQAIVDNNIGICISEYYPTHQMIGKIREILDKYYIRYRIAEYDSKQLFNTPISLSMDSKYPQKCISNGCITISDGMIARCPTLMYVSKFNEYFNQHLPIDGIHKISEYTNGKELLADMKKKVPLCKHCVACEMKWAVCGKEKKLEDFAVCE